MSARLSLPGFETAQAVRAQIEAWRNQGLRIGFVPTMGALHAGHLALIETALTHADRVLASIFVNPAQFAAGEDLDAYPRTFAADVEKLAQAGCHGVYHPTAARMYPPGFSTPIAPAGPAEGLESAARPHFFSGVATVVAKLFNQVRPDIAVFGEKDYQQLLVVRRLVADLDMDVQILAGETVREPDGLAMSSRNAYLAPEVRARAGRLYALLSEAAAALAAGAPVAETLKTARRAAAEAFDALDYIEARCTETLAALADGALDRPARVLGAVRLAGVRLIDNVPAEP